MCSTFSLDDPQSLPPSSTPPSSTPAHRSMQTDKISGLVISPTPHLLNLSMPRIPGTLNSNPGTSPRLAPTMRSTPGRINRRQTGTETVCLQNQQQQPQPISSSATSRQFIGHSSISSSNVHDSQAWHSNEVRRPSLMTSIVGLVNGVGHTGSTDSAYSRITYTDSTLNPVIRSTSKAPNFFLHSHRSQPIEPQPQPLQPPTIQTSSSVFSSGIGPNSSWGGTGASNTSGRRLKLRSLEPAPLVIRLLDLIRQLSERITCPALALRHLEASLQHVYRQAQVLACLLSLEGDELLDHLDRMTLAAG
ncbi:unnamed protein product [Protopolystoma xenopodis]|uniref:Uncharacterized protein n=1 Tax=Protopolystoma xenopodis TaxID=117903 RepID=A0A3S5AX25_9PLAT|nr:unnamed protein product [Protopolystoma xenopodis]